MASEPPSDAPTLTAWPTTDGEDDKLHIQVEENGTVYEDIETHVGMLAANNQYIPAFENPALTLLTLYNRAVKESDGETPDETPDATTDN